MSAAIVTSAKQEALRERMKRLGIAEDDLLEKFVLGKGPGGQKINKTASCVYLQHGPSGIEVKCQRSRSRETNRFLARRALCDRLAEARRAERTRRQQMIEKVRRQKRRRSRRQRERVLEDKRRQSDKKRRRVPVQMRTDE